MLLYSLESICVVELSEKRVEKEDDVMSIRCRQPEISDADPASAGFALYHHDVGYPDVLSAAEELALAHCIEQGRLAATCPDQPGHHALIEAGRRAKQRLIEVNLRLVLYVAHRYQSPMVDFLDLIQEGNLGLMHAVEKFDYRKGYRLSTYAIWWIRQALSRTLAENPQAIALPFHKREQLQQLQKARQFLEHQLQKKPSQEELAKHMKVSSEVISDLVLVSQTQDLLSLDATRRIGEDEIPLSDLLEDERGNTPEHVVMTHTLKQFIHDLLTLLTPLECMVLRLRYGLDDGHEYSLVEIGRKLRLSHEAVRRTEMRALRRLLGPAHQWH